MIKLQCPKCSATEQVDRDPLDPPRATRVEIICPACDDGDRHSPTFFAEDGSEVAFHEGVDL